MRMRTAVVAAATVAAVSLSGLVAAPAVATGPVDKQHGAADGHLPATRSGVDVVGKAPILDRSAGRVSDVTVSGNYAYLGAWQGEGGCQTGGVYIFDIADPTAPRQVGFVPTGAGSFVGEGVQVVSLKTASFSGDVLLFSNEICGAPGTTGGVTMVDVTNPTAPVVLAAGFGDTDGTAPRAHTVHSVFAWQDGPKAYATLVDNEDAADVDIFDVTDPRNPVMVAEYDLAARYPQILQPDVPTLNQVFLHDLVVKKIKGRQVMLASNWDAGYVKLDVTDPTNITYLGDTDFTNPDPELLAQTGKRELPEGNAHYADFTKNNEFVVASDEDFSPYGLAGNTDDGTTFAADQGSDTKPITPQTPLTGTAVYVGRACTGDTPLPTPPAGGGPYLAVAERGGCTFTEKVTNVEAVTANGGYAGTVIVNIANAGGCGAFGMSVRGNKPAVSVDRATGYSFFDLPYDDAACRAGNGELAPLTLGQTGDVVTVRSYFDGWGYVHLFRNSNGKMAELDTFAIPEAMDERFATGSGALSVHEVAPSAQDDSLVYVSYYAGGFRVLKIEDDTLREVGRFIDEGGNDFWGVQVFTRGGKEFVAASDRDYGLYIFQYTGEQGGQGDGDRDNKGKQDKDKQDKDNRDKDSGNNNKGEDRKDTNSKSAVSRD